MTTCTKCGSSDDFLHTCVKCKPNIYDELAALREECARLKKANELYEKQLTDIGYEAAFPKNIIFYDDGTEREIEWVTGDGPEYNSPSCWVTTDKSQELSELRAQLEAEKDDNEILAQISEILVGYREGSHKDILAGLRELKEENQRLNDLNRQEVSEKIEPFKKAWEEELSTHRVLISRLTQALEKIVQVCDRPRETGDVFVTREIANTALQSSRTSHLGERDDEKTK